MRYFTNDVQFNTVMNFCGSVVATTGVSNTRTFPLKNAMLVSTVGAGVRAGS